MILFLCRINANACRLKIWAFSIFYNKLDQKINVYHHKYSLSKNAEMFLVHAAGNFSEIVSLQTESIYMRTTTNDG